MEGISKLKPFIMKVTMRDGGNDDFDSGGGV